MIEDLHSNGLLLILGFAIFLSVFFLGFLSLAYGDWARKRLEIMQKKG